MGYDMYWVDEAEPEMVARYQEVRRQWEASLQVRNAIPKEEQGQYTKEEIDASVFWTSAPANASDRYKAAYDLQERLYEQMHEAEPWYHRRNGNGMRLLCGVMHRLDMIRYGYSMNECPYPWPQRAWTDEEMDDYLEWSSGEWSKEQEAEHDHDHPDRMKAWREYKDALSLRLVWVPEECFKIFLNEHEEVIDETPHAIPGHKFGTNDDWIVTPTECSAVLAKARKVSDDDLRLVFTAEGVTDWDPVPSWQSWLTFIEGAASHGGFTVR
jgi:hypothetical protein